MKAEATDVDGPQVQEEDEDKEEKVSDADKTSLKAAVDVFNKSFMKGMWIEIRRGFREKDDMMAASTVDF